MSHDLASFSPPIPTALLEHLAAINIRSAPDLIFSDTETLLRGLPRGITTLSELKTCIARVIALVAAEGVSADQLYKAEVSAEGEQVMSGISELDDLLGGGLGGVGNGRVIEVSSDSGGGKTAFALHVVMRHLSLHENAAALWIDTTSDLSPERLTRVLPRQPGPAASTVLDRLHISQAFDLDAAYAIVDDLRATLSTSSEAPLQPRIMVIDMITSLLGPHLSAVSSQGHATMTTFMRGLRDIAHTYGLSILVLNASTAVRSSTVPSVFANRVRKPALGPSFTFLTDATIWFARPPDDASLASPAADHERRVAEIVRSRVSRSKLWCEFWIRDGAIVHS
ncbi:P-loop containing nucleoside triphosphate hydrolase protein [Artomyces pyxidatus]|uniref:P-loop containing nucleoside triphosphate hydrolase protein n=1 Tax=Artomyces pyxidatus TaxID=48021 RepID=A0ACB8TG13_9AGAM|nr:P-loop containing nucleoside triphosphate hydrolase protein [Artomyces pyxidatus]